MSADDDIQLTDEQKELLHALNPRQQKFVLNLVGGMNQTQAYRSAGYKVRDDKYNEQSASRLSSNVKVKAAVDSLMKPRAEAVAAGKILSREEALSILTEQARCSLDDVVEMRDATVESMEGPVVQTFMRIKDSDNLSPRAKASIKSVTITNQGPKVELQDRNAAIKLIGQMQGWDKASEKDKEQTNSLIAFVSGITDTYHGNPADIIGGRGDDE